MAAWLANLVLARHLPRYPALCHSHVIAHVPTSAPSMTNPRLQVGDKIVSAKVTAGEQNLVLPK